MPFSLPCSSNVAGVSFDNEDGSSRQDIILGLSSGDFLNLVDCASPKYPEAIGIFTPDNKQIGFLPSWLARSMRSDNVPFSSLKCVVSSVGRPAPNKPYGVSIVFGTTYNSILAYVEAPYRDAVKVSINARLKQEGKAQIYIPDEKDSFNLKFSSEPYQSHKKHSHGPFLLGLILTIIVVVPIIIILNKVISFFN